MSERVNHPKHYGGENDPYEAIKVIEAWALGFNLGNCLKYVRRATIKDEKGRFSTVEKRIEDLSKGAWYLNREIENLQKVLRKQHEEMIELMKGRNETNVP